MNRQHVRALIEQGLPLGIRFRFGRREAEVLERGLGLRGRWSTRQIALLTHGKSHILGIPGGHCQLLRSGCAIGGRDYLIVASREIRNGEMAFGVRLCF